VKLAAASWFGPAIATCVIAGLGYAAYERAKQEVPGLRWLAAAPHATLAAPVKGPAIYTGVLRGPADRKTPLGRRASAFWWSVDERHGKQSVTICKNAARDRLELVDGASAAPLEVLETATSVSLMAGGFGDEWTSRVVIDVTSGSESGTAGELSGEAAKCAGKGRSYSERFVPVGTRVEVLACHGGAALRACPGAIHDAVLAIPTLAKHRERRAESALGGVTAFALGSMSAILVVFVVTLAGKGAVLRGMTPGRRDL
jgi:hypothetical protein